MNENILIDKNQETIETWAYIEIMGHSRIAGRLSQRKLGTDVMWQVDVPKADEGFSHTELYSTAAIFSIKPTTEEWCRRWIAASRSYDVLPYLPPARQLPEPNLFPPSQEELREQFKAEEDSNYFSDEIAEDDFDEFMRDENEG